MRSSALSARPSPFPSDRPTASVTHVVMESGTSKRSSASPVSELRATHRRHARGFCFLIASLESLIAWLTDASANTSGSYSKHSGRSQGPHLRSAEIAAGFASSIYCCPWKPVTGHGSFEKTTRPLDQSGRKSTLMVFFKGEIKGPAAAGNKSRPIESSKQEIYGQCVDIGWKEVLRK